MTTSERPPEGTASDTPSSDAPAHRYTAALADSIELAWQDRWEREGTFNAPNPSGPLSENFDRMAIRPHAYIMDMFPYPSGDGLHVGHPLGYIGTDVYARYLRMRGENVLHTMGFDAFGLPAEQYAVQTGQHPAVDHLRQHRHVPSSAAPDGPGPRPAPHPGHQRSVVLPLDPVDLLEDLRFLVRHAPDGSCPPDRRAGRGILRRSPPVRRPQTNPFGRAWSGAGRHGRAADRSWTSTAWSIAPSRP